MKIERNQQLQKNNKTENKSAENWILIRNKKRTLLKISNLNWTTVFPHFHSRILVDQWVAAAVARRMWGSCSLIRCKKCKWNHIGRIQTWTLIGKVKILKSPKVTRKGYCCQGQTFGPTVGNHRETAAVSEAQKPKTFRIAAFYAQNFSGRSARIHFLQHVKKARNPLSRHIKIA